MYVCAEALTKYNQPSICPWAHSSSARPAAQGTPAPVAPLQVLVLRPPSQTGRQLITEPSEMWPWSLYPAASLQSPPLLHAQIHTLMGSQPDPSLCNTWPGLPAPPAVSYRWTRGFFWTSWPLPSLLLLLLLLHCPQSSHPTHIPSPDPATWALVTHGQTQPPGTETPTGTHSI